MTNFDFSLLQEWEYYNKKVDKKTVVTKLRKIKLTMTYHNLDELKYMTTVHNTTQEQPGLTQTLKTETFTAIANH